MNGLLSSGADEQVQEHIDLLYNQALLLEGSKIKDPAAFARLVAKLITGSTRKGCGSAARDIGNILWRSYGEALSLQYQCHDSRRAFQFTLTRKRVKW
jgi:hypothetical protein